MNGITIHLKTITKTNYLSSTFVVLGTIVILATVITLTMIYSTAGWFWNGLLFAVLLICAIAVLRKKRFFEKTVFDDLEVSFYKFGRLVSKFEWSDIESITIVKSNPITIKGNKFQIPYPVIITKNHYTVPDITSIERGYIKDKNGKSIKINSNQSTLAFVFGIGSADKRIFIDCLKIKRPDFFKMKQKNLKNVGYD